MNQKTYSTLLLAVAASLSLGQSSAEEVLRQAAKACKDLKSAQFTIKADIRSTRIVATTWVQRADVPDTGWAPGRYRVKGTSEEPGGDVEFYDYAYDGKALQVKKGNEDVQVIDHPTMYQAGQYAPTQVVIAGMPIVGEGLDRCLKENPELKSLPEKKVGEWTCDVIEIKRKVSSPVVGDIVLITKWAFDKKTHLPVQHYDDDSTVTVTKLTLNPEIAESTFRISDKTVKVTNPLGPATEHLLKIGTPAPNFSLKDPQGKACALKDFKGKVLVLDFWGTWCLPCRKTMPILQALHKKYGGKNVAVLGISLDQDYDPAAFMKRMGLSYPIAVRGETAGKAYRVEVLPTLYVIGRDGKILYRQAGIQKDDDTRLPKTIATALQKG